MTAKKKLTKAELVRELATMADTEKKTINKMFESLESIIKQQLGKKGPGEFVIPGLVKLRVVDKPAQPEREGINPATREKITIKAKPASRKVRLTALKTLKTMVG